MSSASKRFLIVVQPFDHGVPNFGPMTVGSVVKTEDGKKFDAYIYSRKIGTFKRKFQAVAAVHDYWHQNCSAKALTPKFRSTTRGGKHCKILHATDDAIVAVIGLVPDAFQTSFHKNGLCQMSESRHLDLIPLN